MDGPTIGDMALGLLPMIILVVAWFFFMWQMRRPGSFQARTMDVYERQTKALERIADVLENKK